MMMVHHLLLLAACATATVIVPNVPLPAMYENGYTMGKEGGGGHQTLDVFLGPFCEDSKRMYPILAQLAKAREGATTIRAHIFPLPYNIGSWPLAQACAAAAIISNSSSTAVDCLGLIYEGSNQRSIKTRAMVSATTPQLIDAIVQLLAAPLGVDGAALQNQLAQGLESGASSYDKAKADWKYGCARGVFATPSVFLNGIQLHGYDDAGPPGGGHAEGDLAALTLEQWVGVLDP